MVLLFRTSASAQIEHADSIFEFNQLRNNRYEQLVLFIFHLNRGAFDNSKHHVRLYDLNTVSYIVRNQKLSFPKFGTVTDAKFCPFQQFCVVSKRNLFRVRHHCPPHVVTSVGTTFDLLQRMSN